MVAYNEWNTTEAELGASSSVSASCKMLFVPEILRIERTVVFDSCD